VGAIEESMPDLLGSSFYCECSVQKRSFAVR